MISAQECTPQQLHSELASALRQRLDHTPSLLSPQDAEERLQALTRLYQNGLVNEQEYHSKREEILKRL